MALTCMTFALVCVKLDTNTEHVKKNGLLKVNVNDEGEGGKPISSIIFYLAGQEDSVLKWKTPSLKVILSCFSILIL